MNKQFSKRLALLMVLVMVMAMMPITGFAQANDLSGHWSESVVNEWMTKGLISGYPDGSFKPNGSMTRAEFMAIVNKVYNFTSEKDISYKDVKLSDWYFSIAKKAAAAGYISGYPDGTLKPNQPVTRQEVAAIFCKLESLNADPMAANFKDISTDSWAKGYIGAAVKAGFFTGYSDGTFKGSVNIKRGEAVVATNKVDIVRAVTYTKAGTYGPAIGTEFVSKNVIVKADGVVLQNLTIKGDLTIDESVGEGDVSLNNVVVQGQLFIKGGGANSVKINGGGYGKVFVMKQADTPVRLLVVNVKNLDVVVPQEAGGGQIVLEGVFNSVSVLAPKAQLTTQGNTTINEIKFDKLALEVKVNLGSGTVVMKLVTEVVMTVLGQGRIVVADVKVTGVTFEKLPETVATTVNGTTTTTTNTPSTTPSTGGSTGGSSGGSSSGNDNGGTTTQTAVTPTANKSSGYIASGSSVTLSTTTPNATIYYTSGGAVPTTQSMVYTEPIIVTGSSVTIKAIAVATGYNDSAVLTLNFMTQFSKFDLALQQGSVIFDFNFYADTAMTVEIPYLDMLNDQNIRLSSGASTVQLVITSTSGIATSTSAVSFEDLQINVTSGSVTFGSNADILSAFGPWVGTETGAPNRIVIHLEFIGGQITVPDIVIDLLPAQMQIFTLLSMNAPPVFAFSDTGRIPI